MTKKILVVTNMYPNAKTPAAGVFVQKITQQLQENKEFAIALWIIPNMSNKLLAYFLFYLGFVFKLLIFRPQIVYCHFVSHTGLLGVLAKKLLGCKLILNCHGSDVMNSIHGNKFKYKLNSYLFNRADKIIAPSTFLQSIVNQYFDVLNDQMFIYPSGGVFIPKNLPQREVCKDKHNTLKIGYVGRLTDSKGVKILNQALSALVQVELFVAGGGDISLLEHNLNSNIKLTYLGEVSQQAVRKVYEKIDLLVFPTLLQESLGLTPLEAMAYGVPVIGSDIGAVPEYIINNHTGFLVEAGSVSKLAETIVAFTKMSSQDRVNLQSNASDMAKKYDEKIIVSALIKMINQLD